MYTVTGTVTVTVLGRGHVRVLVDVRTVVDRRGHATREPPPPRFRSRLPCTTHRPQDPSFSAVRFTPVVATSYMSSCRIDVVSWFWLVLCKINKNFKKPKKF